jgi:hypothetical protein
VVVPAADAGEVEQSSAEPGQQPVFEQSDFEQLFGTAAVASEPAAVSAPAPPAAPPAGAWGTHAEPAFEMAHLEPAGAAAPVAAQPPGIVLSPTKATVLTVVAVLALGLAFGAGVLVGKFLL